MATPIVVVLYAVNSAAFHIPLSIDTNIAVVVSGICPENLAKKKSKNEFKEI